LDRAELPNGSRLPDFLVIGAMKAGTTAMEYYLDAHPEAKTVQGEVHYFCCSLHRGPDWYRAKCRIEGLGPDELLGEKTPDYLFNPRAPAAAAELIPDARLIAILRDPVTRAYSHYNYMKGLGTEDLSFAEALDAEPERPGKNGWQLAYTGMGRYAEQLERWTQYYPRSQLHVMIYEDFKADPAGEFARVCDFLGLRRDVSLPIVGQVIFKSHTYRPMWLWKFMRRRRLFRLLPEKTAWRLVAAMRKEVEPEPMDPRVRARLVETFAQDNRELERWLGVRLDAWAR